MIRIIGWIILIVVVAGYFYQSNDNDSKYVVEDGVAKKSATEIRYENADSSQKACVKTLGQGVYKDKSLSWKLDSCNVPK